MKLIWMDLPKKLSLTELQIVRQAERNLKKKSKRLENVINHSKKLEIIQLNIKHKKRWLGYDDLNKRL